MANIFKKINKPRNLLLKGIVPFLILLGVWYIASVVTSQKLLPLPYEVLLSFIGVVKDGTLIKDIMSTLKRILIGFGIASVLGVLLGVSAGAYKRASSYFISLIEFLRPIPPAAWIPIAILWFGIGDGSSSFLVFLGSFFPIFINTYEGVRSVNINHLRAAKNLGCKKRCLISDIIIPAAFPQIFTGLRVGLGVGWICVITAELVGATSGLGYMIQLNRILLQIDNVIVGMIVIGIIGLLMNKLMLVMQRILIPWRAESNEK